MPFVSTFLRLSSCKVVTKDHRIPENQHITIACCYYLLWIILKSCYKRSSHPRTTNTSPRMLLSFVIKIVQKTNTSPSHVATIFCIILQILPLPNEDLGRPDKHFRARFRITFQGCEYPILARKRWKVLRKRALKCLSGLPKSSFGEHKIVASKQVELSRLG
jgi:hypothetical protein